ncbi:unnamed protein product [Schistosoma margrebowiei]|uniref:Uncharacterized protein n=1 Tax=Schistosoma margrebowiei TaxID=48269 RepID=A0A183LDZ7_9TREM|nr:unnamed protein product [Schistosoma margrebowiei]
MKTSTSEGKHGIQWTSRMQLDDLNFADDLALLSQTLEVDRTYIEESTQLHHKTSPHMESSRPKEERRSKKTLRREMEIDMGKMSKNWMELQKKAQDRVGWRMLVGGLCSIGSNRRKEM